LPEPPKNFSKNACNTSQKSEKEKATA